jgi:glycosyltransferase involved in cell wall biosynthesis
MPGRFTRLSLPAEQMPSLYQTADVFLHLSIEESFGNVFVEAMACGLPVVAHDSDRLRWIVGDSEFLCDTASPAEVARQVVLAKEAPASDRQARVERAAGFSWSRIGELYREFLADVVAQYKTT